MKSLIPSYTATPATGDASAFVRPTSLRGMADIASRSGDAVTTAHYYGRLRESGALQVDDVLTLAGVQKRSGQTHEAIGTLESGVVRFGDDARLLSELGLLLALAGRTDEARETLEAAIAIKDSESAYRSLADLLFESGDYDSALPVLLSYAERYPGDFSTHMRAGYILFDRGEFEAASRCYREAIEARPASVDARVALARSYESMDRIDAAVRTYGKALELRGIVREMEPVILAQSNLLNRKRRFERTIDLLEQAGDSFPLSAGLECALGIALAGEGRNEDAVVAFSRAASDRRYGELARSRIRQIEELPR
ncbi:MAG: tetratricopeptide repeat protein [Candidatus Krumholzibacteriota bacterium]|nr:tetratricopeptide repeat protein [Candidatus Krumholzibacteriota bacterium]